MSELAGSTDSSDLSETSGSEWWRLIYRRGTHFLAWDFLQSNEESNKETLLLS